MHAAGPGRMRATTKIAVKLQSLRELGFVSAQEQARIYARAVLH